MKTIKICLIAIVLMVFVIMGFRFFFIRGPRSLESITASQLLSLVNDMHIVLVRSGKQHPITINDVIEMYRQNGRQVNNELTEDGQSVIDAWGTPIVIEFKEPSIYKFMSYGANKKDDKGKGDDILVVYNLLPHDFTLIEQKGIK
ncbi:MAG TPA: hypothetical protein PKB02_15540 [Anaerohalosphaeraceae bacterium]|nr:hypothetical protein [Anaerohalosphaeraceae bacterium]